MDYLRGQKQQSLDVKLYKYRICVNGTRHWSDKRFFHKHLIEYLANLPDDADVLFISGAASSGADDMIISWCKKFGFPCKRFEANWKAEPRSAGYIRNAEMAQYMTHLISFWDSKSRGTKHLIDLAEDAKVPTKIILISQTHENS